MALRAKLTHGAVAVHVRVPGSHPDYFQTLDSVSCWEKADEDTNTGVSGTHTGDLNVVPGSCLLSGLAMAVVSI